MAIPSRRDLVLWCTSNMVYKEQNHIFRRWKGWSLVWSNQWSTSKGRTVGECIGYWPKPINSKFYGRSNQLLFWWYAKIKYIATWSLQYTLPKQHQSRIKISDPEKPKSLDETGPLCENPGWVPSASCCGCCDMHRLEIDKLKAEITGLKRHVFPEEKAPEQSTYNMQIMRLQRDNSALIKTVKC